MKLIHFNECDGAERFINPHYVTEIEAKSTNPGVWSIILYITHRDEDFYSTHQIVFHSKEDCDAKLAEILACMESIH